MSLIVKDVVCAVIVKDDKILACKRRDDQSLPNLWEFPGGKVERYEDYKDALKREIDEELNLEIEVGKFIYEEKQCYPKHCVNLIAYQCEIIGNEIILNEHQAYKWLDLDELETLEWCPADTNIYKHLVENGI